MKKVLKKGDINLANNPPPLKIKLNFGDETGQFAENIINTVREPLLILDQDLKVVTASRSFYKFFKVNSDKTIGKSIYELGNHQWDIPKLKELLETILPEKTTFNNYEVEHDFSSIGKRVMLLNARQIERAFGKEKIILLAIEDITERRGIEKSLSEKNRITSEYLDILLDHAHAPIIIWDSSFVIKRFNHEFEKLISYVSAEIINKKIDILFPEDKIDLTLELIKNNISDDKSEIIEIDILTKNKDIKTVLWNSSNIFDKEGNKIVATIAQDITMHKLTEEALRESETKTRNILEAISTGIIIVDPETHTIEDVNSEAIRMIGEKKEKIIGSNCHKYICPAEIGKCPVTDLGQMMDNSERILIGKEGKRIPILKTVTQINLGGRKLLLENFTDITDRKLAEEAIFENEEKFRKLATSAQDSIIMMDDEGKFFYWNEAFEKLFQYTSSEIKGKVVHELIVPKRFFNDFYKNFTKYLVTGEGNAIGKTLELSAIKKNGDEFPVELSLSTLMLQGKRMSLGILRNITSRKLAEAELRESELEMKALLNAIPDLIFRVNREGTFLDYKADKADLYGQSGETIIGKNFRDILSPKFADLGDKYILQSLNSGEIQEFEYQMPSPELGLRDYEARMVTSGKDEVIALVRDITDRKIAEKKLAASEERYRLLFQSAAEGILVVDVETKKHKLANKAICQMFGYTEPEMIGLSIKDMHPPEILEFVISEFESQAQAERPFSADIPCLRKDGKIFFANIYNAIVYIDDRKHNIGFFTDITSQKEAIDKIKLFRTLIDQSNDSVELIDLETGGFLDCNEKAYRELGYTREEFLSLKLYNIDPNLTEDNFPERIKLIRDSGSLLVEGMHSRKDGTEIPVEINIKYVKLERDYIVAVVRNITERKLVEEKLRSSEEMFKIIFDYAPEAYYINDLKGNFINGNIAAEKLLGYKSDELIGKSFFKLNLLSPIQILKAAKLLAKNLVGKATGPDEFVLDRKDGSKVTVEISTYPVKIKDNTLVLGIARDITESKQLEQEKEILTYSLNERVKELTCLYTIASIFETTDISLDKMFNQVVNSIPPGWQYSDICCARIVLYKNEYQTTNYRETAWKMSANIMIDGKLRGIVEVFYLEEKEEVDEGPFLKEERELLNQIAERMGQILERKKLESDLYTAAEIAKLGYWEYDVDSGNVILNDQYFSLVHGSSSEKQDGNIMSMDEFALKFVHPDDLELITNALQEAKESLEIDYLGKSEVRAFRENGDIAYVSVQFKVLKDQLGRTYKIYGVSQDITERKHAERELIEAKEKAEEMNRLKTNFLANMSHELRTPLIGILGYAEFLINELQDPNLIEMVSTIKTSGRRLNNTLNNILNISKIESERQQNNFKMYDLIKIVKEQINLFKAAAEGKNLLLTLETEEEKLDAFVDENMFISIINNLLNNAIKYTDKGSVTLTAKTDRNNAIIEVRDTGIGVPQALQETIFEPFRQASEGYGRSFEGTGLGLTLVKKFMELMGGTIILKSIPADPSAGKAGGSTFILKFPIEKIIVEDLINTNWV